MLFISIWKMVPRQLITLLFSLSSFFSLIHGEQTIQGENGAFSSLFFKRIKREDDKLCLNSGKWDESKQRCTCTLGWVGIRCAIWRYNECYFDGGSEYRGNFSLTKSGQHCLPWTAKENKRFPIGEEGIGTHNYCRNPDNDENGPWCYVGGTKFHEICNITLCSDENRALLLINATDQNAGTSDAVKILFGPLISGICVGVVALLGFIAAAEYFRRKRNAKRKKEQDADAIKKSDIQHTDHDSIRERHVRTFGGIVTVDVDTGKQKTKTVKMKTVSKAENAIKEATREVHHNDAFVMDLDRKITSSGSCDNLKEIVNKEAASSESPPPPYQETEVIEYSGNDSCEIKKDGDGETPPKAVKRRTKRKKDIKLPKEEPTDLPEPPPPPMPVPVPRPRKSIGSSPPPKATVVVEKDEAARENRPRNKRRKRRPKTNEKVEEVTSESQTGSPEMRTNKIVNEHKKRRTKRQNRKSTTDDATWDSSVRRNERRRRKEANGDAVQTAERRSRRKREPTEGEVRKDNKETNDADLDDSKEVEAINKALRNKLNGKKKSDEPSTFI